jgi:hypothetical protein
MEAAHGMVATRALMVVKVATGLVDITGLVGRGKVESERDPRVQIGILSVISSINTGGTITDIWKKVIHIIIQHRIRSRRTFAGLVSFLIAIYEVINHASNVQPAQIARSIVIGSPMDI